MLQFSGAFRREKLQGCKAVKANNTWKRTPPPWTKSNDNSHFAAEVCVGSACEAICLPGMFDLGTGLTRHIPPCNGNNLCCWSTSGNCWHKPDTQLLLRSRVSSDVASRALKERTRDMSKDDGSPKIRARTLFDEQIHLPMGPIESIHGSALMPQC